MNSLITIKSLTYETPGDFVCTPREKTNNL